MLHKGKHHSEELESVGEKDKVADEHSNLHLLFPFKKDSDEHRNFYGVKTAKIRKSIQNMDVLNA